MLPLIRPFRLLWTLNRPFGLKWPLFRPSRQKWKSCAQRNIWTESAENIPCTIYLSKRLPPTFEHPNLVLYHKKGNCDEPHWALKLKLLGQKGLVWAIKLKYRTKIVTKNELCPIHFFQQELKHSFAKFFMSITSVRGHSPLSSSLLLYYAAVL